MVKYLISAHYALKTKMPKTTNRKFTQLLSQNMDKSKVSTFIITLRNLYKSEAPYEQYIQGYLQSDSRRKMVKH